MDPLLRDVLYAVLLGIVEGVTEFLPISSTGHLLLVQKWLGLEIEGENADPFWVMFAIFIQIGAIASVFVYFRKRIMDLLRSPAQVDAQGNPLPRPIKLLGNRAVILVIIGSMPLVIAYFAEKWSQEHFYGPVPIALALGIGGVLIILIEKLRPTPRTEAMEQMSYAQALLVGFCQILAAIFPGTSRSAATILGGLSVGLSRHAAAEFSFFLALPAMTAASGYKLLKNVNQITPQQGLVLAVGTVVSFLVAWAVIAWLMSFIRRHSFVPFAIYRIILAVVVLLVMW